MKPRKIETAAHGWHRSGGENSQQVCHDDSSEEDSCAQLQSLDNFTCGTPNGKEVLWLRQQGVSLATMTRPWIIGADKVCFDGTTFDFSSDGDRALIFRAEDSGRTTDLVAWSARENRLATWRGQAFALGELDAIWVDDRLRVHRTPLDWLKHNREGIVIVQPGMAYAYLRHGPDLLFEDADLAREVREWTQAPEPKIEFLVEVA